MEQGTHFGTVDGVKLCQYFIWRCSLAFVLFKYLHYLERSGYFRCENNHNGLFLATLITFLLIIPYRETIQVFFLAWNNLCITDFRQILVCNSDALVTTGFQTWIICKNAKQKYFWSANQKQYPRTNVWL